MKKRILLAFLMLLSPVASAQPAAPTNPAGLSNSIFKLMNQSAAPAGAASASPGTTPAAPAKAVNWTFKPSAQQRKALVDRFVNAIAETDPNTAAEWRKLFDTQDMFAEVEKAMTKQAGAPMSVNNVVDVWASYWGNMWLMARGRTDDPTPKQMAGLRAQFKTLLSSVNTEQTLTDSQKQELGDSMALQLLLYAVLLEAYQENPAELKEFASGLMKQSKDMGFDLSLLNLTDQGLVLIKK